MLAVPFPGTTSGLGRKQRIIQGSYPVNPYISIFTFADLPTWGNSDYDDTRDEDTATCPTCL